MSDEGRPEQFDFFQSTSQGFYYINEILINGNPIESDDWVAAFNGDICVGARQWDKSQCGGGICDVPVMGADGTSKTSGYMSNGDIPSFKVFDSSEQIFIDMDFYNYHPNSEDLSWYNFAITPLDQLININYSFANASDFENTATITSIFNDDVYAMSINDILVAYANEEIRGITTATINNIASGEIFFCSIFLNQMIEDCNFKYYNYDNKLIFDIEQSFTLYVNDSLGDALNPETFSIEGDELGIPDNNILLDDFSLIKAYPNPFNPIVNISLDIINPHSLDISIFDMKGDKVDRIFKGYKGYGKYEYQWDASNFPSGVYFAVIEGLDDRSVISEKICLMK